MTSYIETKRQIKHQIMQALDAAGAVDREKLIAELSLNTGFTEKVIKKILFQMAQLDYIKIDGNIVSLPSYEKPDQGEPSV